MLFNEIKLTRFILTIVAALAWPAVGEAAVYKCTDANHRTFYQDRPCQDMTSARLSSNLASLSAKEEERAFFWKATGEKEKGTLYLLGSLHFGAQSPFLMPQTVLEAFAASEILVVEADLRKNTDKEIAALTRDKGHYADKSDLESHVKQTTWNRTVETGKKLGLGEETLRPLKPWLAAITLASQAMKKAGYSPELGIDQTFLKKSEGAKPVLELESMEGQMQLFEDLTGQEQEQMLIQTLHEVSRIPELYQTIVDAWKKGDAESMDLITRQSFDPGELGSKLFRVFYEERNQRMSNKLAAMAGDGRTYFVVVGAGHLGGEKGILRLLQGLGFKVTQP